MAQKTPRSLVALSGSAIAAIYLAGYLTTRGADARQPTPIPTPTLAPTVVEAANTPTAIPTALPLSTPTRTLSTATPAPSTPTANAVSSLYRDGTYTGVGNSRRGGFDVAVTIQGGKISN